MAARGYRVPTNGDRLDLFRVVLSPRSERAGQQKRAAAMSIRRRHHLPALVAYRRVVAKRTSPLRQAGCRSGDERELRTSSELFELVGCRLQRNRGNEIAQRDVHDAPTPPLTEDRLSFGCAEARLVSNRGALLRRRPRRENFALCGNRDSAGVHGPCRPRNRSSFSAGPLSAASARISRAGSWRRHLPPTSRAVSSVATETPSSQQGSS